MRRLFILKQNVNVNKRGGGRLSSKIETIIQTYSSRFTKSEIKIADYIKKYYENVMYLSITELSDLIGVGEATILRFCRKIGYRGYQDFKLAIAKEPDNQKEGISEHSFIDNIHQNLIESLNNTRYLIDENELEKACLLLDQVQHIYVYGVGSSGITATEACSKLLRIGKHTQAITDSHFQAMNSATLLAGDLIIAITVSGSTIDVLEAVQLAKERGCLVIAMTSYIKSPITKLADVVLLTSGRENPLEGGSLSVKVSQLYLVDLLCRGVALLDITQAEQMKKLTAEAVSNKLN